MLISCNMDLEDRARDVGTDYAPQVVARVTTPEEDHQNTLLMLKTLEQELMRGFGFSMPLVKSKPKPDAEKITSEINTYVKSAL